MSIAHLLSYGLVALVAYLAGWRHAGRARKALRLIGKP